MDALREQASKAAAKESGKPAAKKKSAGDQEKQLGDTYVVRGEFNEAVDWYSKALEKDPENEEFWTARSSALLRMHCCREALLDARTAVQLAPHWHEGYYQLGLAFQELSMLGYAQTAFQNAKRMCPVFEEADKKLEALGRTLAERHAQQHKLATTPLSLCQCVYAGDAQAVRDYVSSGKSLSPEFVTLPHRELFMTPMQVALLNQYFDIAQFLLDSDILFPENVCDWMVAQSVSERKARREAEAAAKAAQEELAALKAEGGGRQRGAETPSTALLEATVRQLQEELDRITAERDR
eukprot:EG_transcript_21977